MAALSAYGVETGLHDRPMAITMSTAVAGQPSVSMDSLVESPALEPVRSFTLTAETQQIHPPEPSTLDTGRVLPALLDPAVRVARCGPTTGACLAPNSACRRAIAYASRSSTNCRRARHPLARTAPTERGDGVVGVTQDAVPLGQSFTYEFVAKDPGTYWYHSHQNTEGQLPRGLYGALVVEPRLGPTYDRDYAVIVSPNTQRRFWINFRGATGKAWARRMRCKEL